MKVCLSGSDYYNFTPTDQPSMIVNSEIAYKMIRFDYLENYQCLNQEYQQEQPQLPSYNQFMQMLEQHGKFELTYVSGYDCSDIDWLVTTDLTPPPNHEITTPEKCYIERLESEPL